MTGQSIQFDKRFAGLKPPAPVDPKHAALVKQTQKWVSQTFFGAMLKQMRNSPFKSELFNGGRGGEAFNELYDQRLADHMSRASGAKLVKAIVKKIEAAGAYRKSSKLPGNAALGMGQKNPPSAAATRAAVPPVFNSGTNRGGK